MSEPVFLTLDDVLGIHADQIRVYGGASGLRDLELLRSAIAMPETTFDGEYLHPSAFEMAAAYLFHLVRNHPFVDGNKRTALMCAFVFLGLNEASAFRMATYPLVDRLGTQAEQARNLPNGLAALDQANHHCAAILAASRIRVNSYRLEAHPSSLRHQIE